MSDRVSQVVLELHALATAFMAGVAWFVQVVHYPLMARVGAAGWNEYEQAHGQRTTWVVMPAMLSEALTAFVLAWRSPGLATVTGLALVGALWLSTFLVQVPLHARLERGFDAGVHARLVMSSWFRTGAWSVRAVLAVSWL